MLQKAKKENEILFLFPLSFLCFDEFIPIKVDGEEDGTKKNI